jgi:hypothetical protein
MSDRDGLSGARSSLLLAGLNAAIDGVEIGPSVGSCGTAAHLGHAIFVTDIERDALLANSRELALRHELRACWSAPFHSKDGTVLGTLALYYRERRGPTEHDRATVKFVGNTAAVIVENARLHSRLKDLNDSARLAADAGGPGFFTWEIATDQVRWHNERPYAIFGHLPLRGAGDCAQAARLSLACAVQGSCDGLRNLPCCRPRALPAAPCA